MECDSVAVNWLRGVVMTNWRHNVRRVAT